MHKSEHLLAVILAVLSLTILHGVNVVSMLCEVMQLPMSEGTSQTAVAIVGYRSAIKQQRIREHCLATGLRQGLITAEPRARHSVRPKLAYNSLGSIRVHCGPIGVLEAQWLQANGMEGAPFTYSGAAEETARRTHD